MCVICEGGGRGCFGASCVRCFNVTLDAITLINHASIISQLIISYTVHLCSNTFPICCLKPISHLASCALGLCVIISHSKNNRLSLTP